MENEIVPKLPDQPLKITKLNIDITPKDLPEDWPDHFKDLGTYIIQMWDEENPELFQLQLCGLKHYVQAIAKAVEMYEDLAWDDDPSVPEWYQQINAWRKDADDESLLEDLLCAALERDLRDTDRCKMVLLLDLMENPWPDHLDALLCDIDRFIDPAVEDDQAQSN